LPAFFGALIERDQKFDAAGTLKPVGRSSCDDAYALDARYLTLT